MKTKVSKWGNSLALRLPKQVALNHGIKEGENLEITEEQDGFFIRPVRNSLSLADLISRVTPDNIHSEPFSDSPRGKEIW